MLAYSLLQELSRRGGLRIALSGRTEDQLIPLLQYLCKYIINVNNYKTFTSTEIDLC